MNVLLGEFDGTSRIPGSRLGALALYEILQESLHATLPSARPIRVGSELRNSALFCREVERIADSYPISLALGGEHLLTFPLLVSLKKQNPHFKLLIFDAHHDAYPYPLATHYSFLYHVLKELKLETLLIGPRHELDRAHGNFGVLPCEEIEKRGSRWCVSEIQSFLGQDPYYVSLDLDVLDPGEMPCVSSPVEKGLSGFILKSMLENLPCTPRLLGADIVEFNPLFGEKTDIRNSLKDVLKPLIQKVCPSCL